MKVINTVFLSAALFVGSALVAVDFASFDAGIAHAGLRDGGGSRGGGLGGGNRAGGLRGGGNLVGGRASSIDRQPRASSAKSGAVRPGSSRPAQGSAGKAASGGRPAGLSSVADAKAGKGRTADAGQQRDRKDIAGKMDKPPVKDKASSARGNAAGNRAAPKKDLRNKKVSTQQRDVQKRDLQKGRKDYAAKRNDIEKDRGDTLLELQENRQEFKQQRREDRMDFAEERREDRMDFREDMLRERSRLYGDLYYHHHYWGYNDNDNWFWLLFGGIAGYAIGASINDQPEGSVPVSTGNTTYQYYGGTFYQASADGNGYTTVPAPANAQVEAPPIDCTIVFTPPPDDLGYCYFQGAFFLYDDKTDNYVVTIPRAGTEVPYLPEGYETKTVDGVEYYILGAVAYRAYMAGDKESFVVAELP
jgi:hypothetical protein